ncbi:FxLYD domain-containing protein [uncultured Thiothrix sp.]|jgi:hypothetical protein|uniref:FxLYD domain-containing protein n=1 Tax=uncultured Thiothrix sp. TaxID=223185 RepID=UPI00260CB8B2|nr:FxLYD domain-containing protein [uncultured Thiothrix sp.]HMT92320.1 FxLYD domain-containing protein [Thiolinea sp.]
MLIKCPECTKDISDTVAACPHCGYTFKSIPLINQSNPKKKVAIFQYVAICALVVALFTPKILISIPCLVLITTGIISLVRKEPRWWLSLISVIFGLAIIGSTSSIAKTDTSYIDKMHIQDWRWEKEGNYTYVRGRVKNIGDSTVSYFKITSYYKNVSGDIIDTDFTNSGEQLQPGMAKEFEIMHKESSEYKTVSIAIDTVRTQ